MAWTQADVDALDNAIKSGTKRVRFSDREVEYMSMSDLLMARNLASAEVAAATPTQPPMVRQRRLYTDKGWSW